MRRHGWAPRMSRSVKYASHKRANVVCLPLHQVPGQRSCGWGRGVMRSRDLVGTQFLFGGMKQPCGWTVLTGLRRWECP